MVPMRRLAPVIVVLAVLAGACSSTPGTYHRSDVAAIGTNVLPEGTIRHNQLRSGDLGFARILALLPDPLPRPSPRSETCFGTWAFTLALRNASALDYSSCHQPAWVATVVHAMQALANACYEPHDALPYLSSDAHSC